MKLMGLTGSTGLMFEEFHPTRIFSSVNGRELLDFIDRSLESGVGTIVVNFQNVKFMDSSGLGSLVTAHKRLKNSGGSLLICGLNGQARMLLEMTSMDRVFNIYNSLRDAREALAPQV